MKLGKFELDKIYIGDCRDLTKDLPNNSIDMSITSPPYWGGLRDYGKETEVIWDGEENCKHKWIHTIIPPKHKDNGKTKSTLAGTKTQEQTQRTPTEFDFCSKCGAWKGQLGSEPDFNLYIKHLCNIFDEVKRVLKKEGTCWVNIGDVYCGGHPGGSIHTGLTKKYNEKVIPQQTKGRPAGKLGKLYKEKSLILIPFRFAIEMVNRGWILRNVIIWHKPNCMPSSVKDRFTVDFEYLFFFSKSKKYWFEQQFESYSESYLKENRPMGVLRQRLYKESKYQKYEYGSNQFKNKRMPPIGGVKKAGGDNPTYSGNTPFYKKQGRNKRTVWKIGSKYTEAEGHSNRAGLQREPTLREKRINEIIQKEIANYLRKYVTKENKNILDKEFGEHKWPHWIRTDESGASLPSSNDWIQLKEILNFDNKYDDIMTETEIYLDDGMMWKNKGKNKRAVWSITTRGFKEAHFAVFPPKLIETPIKAGCPENGVVLDPFIGSGTTGEVAIKQRKHFIGFEINPDYIKIANKRLANIQVSML